MRCVFLKSGALCAYSEGVVRDPEQSSWGLALVRVFPWVVGVVDCVHSAPGPGAGAPLGVDARCRHCEGVVDIVRGLSTPRGGYNARSCQQRASVRVTRARVDNARRCRQPALTATVARWSGGLDRNQADNARSRR